jgi:signal transduction histidine kinase
MSAVDLHGLLEDACREVRGLADLREIRIRLSLGEGPAFVSGNPGALRRLFLVLLDNALKYSLPGGEVMVTLEGAGSRVIAGIQDSGIGIAPEDLPHIFKRFYRADKSRTGGGHGLGLSLAESIALAHEATIDVLSAAGSGSTFRVNFPRRTPVEYPAPAAQMQA